MPTALGKTPPPASMSSSLGCCFPAASSPKPETILIYNFRPRRRRGAQVAIGQGGSNEDAGTNSGDHSNMQPSSSVQADFPETRGEGAPSPSGRSGMVLRLRGGNAVCASGRGWTGSDGDRTGRAAVALTAGGAPQRPAWLALRLNPYICSGADIPMRWSVRASTVREASTSLRRAAVMAGSSTTMTRHCL